MITDHLQALYSRLSHEQDRLLKAKPSERKLREVWIKQIKNEIEREKKFIGITEESMTDEELLNALKD